MPSLHFPKHLRLFFSVHFFTGKKYKILQIFFSLLFASLALLSAIILLTYNKNDPAWTTSGTSVIASNALGKNGAVIADIILSLFGSISFFFPLMLALYAHQLFKQEKLTTKGHIFLQSLILSLIILTGSAIFYLYLPQVLVSLPYGKGGMLGAEISNIIIRTFGLDNLSRVTLGIFFLGVSMFSGSSWFSVMEFIGHWACQGFLALGRYLYGRLRQLGHQYISKKIKAPPQPKKVSAVKESFFNIKSINFFKVDDSKISDAHKSSTLIKKIIPDKKPMNSDHMFKRPESSLLSLHEKDIKSYSEEDLENIASLIEKVLSDFGVSVKVVDTFPGPVITQFELQLAPGIKVSRITTLSKDLARGLSISKVRVVEIIEGKSVIGLEIPNKERQMVSFESLVGSTVFNQETSALTLILGKGIAGQTVMADLGKMPHLLVAGTTGSGKSVAINTMILSLLFKASPKQVRLIMIDPKMLELSVYEGIPHLLTPVVTDMNEASQALRWAVAEMERRYQLMSKLGVRNLQGFNLKVDTAKTNKKPIIDPLFKPDSTIKGKQRSPYLEPLPHIVIVIDELADMMMIVGKKVEELIARIAQKARAAGIHLILATQRPSVDVLTGLIKANIPTRISFQVSSKIDSRTIIDQSGAESLLGNGDMLYLPSGKNIPTRVHGAFVDDDEVHKVVNFLKKSAPPDYLMNLLEASNTYIPGLDQAKRGDIDFDDELYEEAVALVTQRRKATISSIQRSLRIGYNRAARLIDEMESAGVVSEPEKNGTRKVLAPPS